MSVAPSGTAQTGGTPNDTTATSMTCTVASSTAGDINIIAISEVNGTATASTVTPATGWAIWPGTTFVTDGASPQLGGSAYFRVFQAGDSTSPVFGFSTGTNATYATVAYNSTTGFDPTTPVVNNAQSAYTGTTTAKTTDTVTAQGRIVWGYGDRSGGGYSSVTGPGTPTLLANSSHTSSSTVVIYDSNGDVASGSQQSTATGPNTSVGWSFIGALLPAAAGASGLPTSKTVRRRQQPTVARRPRPVIHGTGNGARPENTVRRHTINPARFFLRTRTSAPPRGGQGGGGGVAHLPATRRHPTLEFLRPRRRSVAPVLTQTAPIPPAIVFEASTRRRWVLSVRRQRVGNPVPAQVVVAPPSIVLTEPARHRVVALTRRQRVASPPRGTSGGAGITHLGTSRRKITLQFLVRRARAFLPLPQSVYVPPVYGTMTSGTAAGPTARSNPATGPSASSPTVNGSHMTKGGS